MPVWLPSGRITNDIFKTSRQYLMESLEVQKYLTGDCGLHPQVLVDSAIGVIPPDINFSGAPLPNTLYVAALANKLSERPAQSALPPSAGPVHRLHTGAQFASQERVPRRGPLRGQTSPRRVNSHFRQEPVDLRPIAEILTGTVNASAS